MTKLMIRPTRLPVFNDFENIFEDFFSRPGQTSECSYDFVPRVNVRETTDKIRLTFELPGMDKKDIKVWVENDMLNVTGNREFKSESNDGDYIRQEMRSGEFSRSFTLPETVNREKISADYKNGLLEVSLDKLEEVKPKEIEVKIS
ncbi:MAG: Hsp20/alpha crystallin family protein [Candidatus Zixiibacteriota bacterium]|nr:MAG: Hsp20/alpha crystallin family protein [candidate division Zixibacteria bacterium]